MRSKYWSADWTGVIWGLLLGLACWPAAAQQAGVESLAVGLPDRAAQLQQRLDEGKGNLRLAPGKYRIGKTILVDLAKHGGASISAEGAVTVIMTGEGPAFRFVGTHEGTAAPSTFKPETWRQRMPLIDGIEIVGAHEKADGVELEGTVKPILTRLVLRKLRHGIRLVNRNRNVIISSCHVYENRGIGIFLDDVNLHQINVGDCHISYNREGGVVVRDGNVRNLQIGNCDIEGNMPDDGSESLAANILIDSSAGRERRSIAEIVITGCTIQHNSKNPKGANIRMLGYEGWPIDQVAIGNNIMSDASVNLHFDYVRSATVTGNTFFTPIPRDALITRSARIVFTGNVFDPRHLKKGTVGGVVFRESSDCILGGVQFVDLKEPKGALVVQKCKRFSITGCSLRNCANGIVFKDVEDSIVSATMVSGTAPGGMDLKVEGGSGVVFANNVFGGETEGVPSR